MNKPSNQNKKRKINEYFTKKRGRKLNCHKKGCLFVQKVADESNLIETEKRNKTKEDNNKTKKSQSVYDTKVMRMKWSQPEYFPSLQRAIKMKQEPFVSHPPVEDGYKEYIVPRSTVHNVMKRMSGK